MTDYKLVPVVPTVGMAFAGVEVYGIEECPDADVHSIWEAMLSAVPATQPHGAESVWMYKGNDGEWKAFMNEQHRLNTIADGGWEVREFFATPVMQGEPVGVVGSLPGTKAFTTAVFESIKVPVGTKLYTTPQPAKQDKEWPAVPDKFYEGLGWMHAECCAALDQGEDPRTLEVGDMVNRCIRDLTPQQPTFTVGTDLSDGKLTVMVLKHEGDISWVVHTEVIQLVEQQPDITQLVEALVKAEQERNFLIDEYERAVGCGAQGFAHAAGHLFNAITNAKADINTEHFLALRDERDALKDDNLRLTKTLVEALEKYEFAFKDLFAQCCSNPVTNTWGQPVSMAALNDAHAFASSCLATYRKGNEK